MASGGPVTENEVLPVIRIPKEHAPLDYLLSQIPKKAQKGMLTQCDLILTSIDANEKFIALGCNVGVVFLYKRKEKELERLRTNSHNDVITSVAIHSGLEQQVAVGTEKGVVYLFQLPSVMPSQSKELQQFIVKEIHKGEVKCLCWSLNGMKLFSGDKKGVVSCTEVDFYARVCETNICLIESNCEIVQLNHAHKSLLISTNHRTVLYRTDAKMPLVQIGQKERKVFGNFGAVFIQGLCKPEDAELYACRPGLRIWKSKIDGSVVSTYLFKELVNNPHPPIELLPFHRKPKMFLPESQFGPLYLYKDKYIVTWSDCSMFILNPENTSVIGGTFHVGTIRSIAVTGDEIFVLRKETDRNVIRIAERPESLSGNTYHRLVKDHAMPDFMTAAQSKDDNAHLTPSPLRFIKENVIDKIKNLEIASEGTSSVSDLAASVDKHSEQKELPPVVKLDNPDLITIELFSDSSPSKESVDQIKHSPIRRDRFNPFTKEDSTEIEDELDTSKLSLCNKPHSVSSTTAPSHTSQQTALQYNITQQTTMSHDPNQQTTMSHDPNQQTTMPHDFSKQEASKSNVKVTEPGVESAAGSIDRIRKVPIDDSKDDIAISVKTKKKKKKKADHKLSLSPRPYDSDTVSQNSTEGIVELAQTTQEEKSDKESNQTVSVSEVVDISDIIGLKPVQSKMTDIIGTVTETEKSDMASGGSNSEEMNKDSNKSENSGAKLSVDQKLSESDQIVTCIHSEIENMPIVQIAEPKLNEGKVKDNIQKSVVEQISDKPVKKTTENNSEKILDDMTGSKRSPNDNTKVKPSIDKTKGIPKSQVDTKTTKTGKAAETKSSSVTEENTSPVSSLKTRQPSNVDRAVVSDDQLQFPIATKVKNSQLHKESAFTKLEKNLANLEKGLISNASSGSVYEFSKVQKGETKSKKEVSRSLNVSEVDSGNDSLSEDKYVTPLPVGKDKSDKLIGSPMGASSPRSPVSDQDSFYKSSADSADDFYSKYNLPENLVSPSESGPQETSEHPILESSGSDTQEVPDSKSESIKICDLGDTNDDKPNKVFNTWTEVFTSGNLSSLAMSESHIWCTDKSSNLWHSNIKTPGIKWTKANGYAKAVSVSRSGMIIWRLYKDTVYAGTKITAKHPEGMKWVEAIREVQSIAVDNNCAWYIKSNGEVAIQKELSRERPCYKSTFIECSYKLQQIACRSGVVWAITDQCKLIYRAGIKNGCMEGKEWAEYVRQDGMMFSCVTFGDGNIAWAVDILGRIFFMTNVTMKTPMGDNCWWQVPINNEVSITDFTLLDNIKSLAKLFDPQKLADILSTQKGGLITAGVDGVCVCPEFKNILHMCRGSIEGHYWNEVHFSGVVASTAWKMIYVSAMHLEWGLIWTLQPNGELFTYSPHKKIIKTVERPPKGQFVCMSVCEEAVWGINEDGQVYIRSGIGDHCPQGAEWCELDLKQLGDTHLIHLSCGSRNVWTVDIDGTVYQRIGVKAPSSHSLQAAWLPVDSGPTGTTFTQVYTGPTDSVVWAVDNRRQTYVRLGITDIMPIGTSWLHIPGIQVQQLAISKSFVWALDLNGEILCRHGITEDSPGGDYWRKIPGIFIHISCSINDKLWAINGEGQIFCRKTRYLLRKESSDSTEKRRASSSISVGEDWELV